jgi:ATP-dependent RNA helicase RhlE
MLFENLNLIEPILQALKTEGYTTPTPIQAKAIPFILEKHDVLGCAQTGTGKTAAFAIPILQLLTQNNAQPAGKRKIRTLILTPTRELAIQIEESFSAYGKNTNIKHTVIFGGVSQKAQTDSLARGVDVLVATPGRLLDLIQQRFISLDSIEIFVLDEADRMLDMGFINDIKKILPKLPAKKQTLFFSATMAPEIQKLANTILKDPKKVEVTPVATTAHTVEQGIYFVEKADKKALLLHLLAEKFTGSTLVFTRTKHGADKVVKDLVKAGIGAEAIHGNKSQNARQRALSNFKEKKTRILVATDIASRGIDIEELPYVINYELPNEPETYVHRIGRTGRAGATGIAFSFCDFDEREYLRDIQKLIGKMVPVIGDHPYVSKGIPSPQTPRQEGNNFNRGRNSGNRNNNSRNGNRNSGNKNTGNDNRPANQGNKNSSNSSKPGFSANRNSGSKPASSENKSNNRENRPKKIFSPKKRPGGSSTSFDFDGSKNY